MGTKTLARWVIATALAVFAAGGALAAEEAAEKRLPDIIVFVVDTQRSDHMSVYGYERPTSPHVEALAKEGLTFTSMRSVCSWTLPAVGTFFSSNYPTAHGLRANNSERKVRSLRHGVVTLTEALKRMDYYTILLSANPWLKLEDRTGIERDFDRYEVPGYIPAKKLNEYARRWVNWYLKAPAHKNKPLFLYVHYQEPHGPWFAPRLAPEVLGPVTSAVDHSFTPEQASAHRNWLEFPPHAEERYKTALHVRDYVNAYDETVYAWDGAMGELIAWMKEIGRYDDAIVVVTADHGEELWDHGNFGHGYSLFEEQVRIPFVFRPPGGAKARRIETPVNLLDVAPTILAEAGVPKPPSMKGRDVRNGAEPKPLFAEVDSCRGSWGSCMQRAVWVGDKKLYLTCNRDGCEVGKNTLAYDLKKDPAEKEPDRKGDAELEKLLHEWHLEMKQLAVELGESRTGQIDESVSERLRLLGY